MWSTVGSLDELVADWRRSPQTSGRMSRLALAECSSARRIGVGAVNLRIEHQAPIYAPDLLDSISRFGIANFVVVRESKVRVVVRSSVHGSPFFRVETCGEQDPGAFVNMFDGIVDYSVAGEAKLPEGTYFIVAGSWGNVSGAGQTEAIEIEVAP